MMDDINLLFSAVLVVLFFASALYIIRVAREKEPEEDSPSVNFNSFVSDVINAVLTARQIYDTHDQIMVYVLGLISTRYPEVDPEEVRSLVNKWLNILESAVQRDLEQE